MLFKPDNAKVEPLISTTEVGRIISVTLHCENAPLSINVIEVGMTTTSRFDANKNIWYEMTIREVGRFITTIEEQPPKAKFPTEVTEVGIFTFKSFVAFMNKLTGRDVTLVGMMTVTRL